MPPLLRSNACSYIVQGISTTRSRHPPERQQTARQTAAGIPTIGGSIPDNRQPVSPTPLPHTSQGGTLRVAALQSIMKPHFTPHLYLYLYIYKYIYKYKIFLWYLLLLGKQLQHCNAARNCARTRLLSLCAPFNLFHLGVRPVVGATCRRNGHRRYNRHGIGR